MRVLILGLYPGGTGVTGHRNIKKAVKLVFPANQLFPCARLRSKEPLQYP